MPASTSLPVTNKKIAWFLVGAVGLIVILLLVAMLLPVMQAASEAGRRNRPVNGVKQLDMALQNHHDAYQKAIGGQATDALKYQADEDLPSLAIMVNSGPVAADKSGGQTDLPAAALEQADDPHRKIIYSAELHLVVEDFAGIGDKVTAVVKQFDGYVAGSNLSGAAGESRGGTWKLRVPVARFDEFVAAAKQLGEVASAGTSSRDVSEEYYDVDARIRNKAKEEQRLLKLLEERPGKLEDVIAIERELSRVREELERMQGRMRVLTDLTSLTTVDLAIVEIKNYQPEDAPTLATRIRRSFDASFAALGATGADLLVVLAALAVWLPVLAAIFCGLWIFLRRLLRWAHGSVLRQDVP